MHVEAVVDAHRRELLLRPDVASVGVGFEDGKSVILVFVHANRSGETGEGLDPLPDDLDGYRVVVRPELLIGRPGDSAA